MPTKVLNYNTPLECLKLSYPDSRINLDLPTKIFGCIAYVHLPKRTRSKLDPRAEKCVFLGYNPNQMGYKCFNPSSKRSYVTMDVSFLEITPFFDTNIIQGENLDELDLRLQKPLPSHSSESVPNPIKTNDKVDEPTIFAPHIDVTDREILQLKQPEYLVYTRKGLSEKCTDQATTEHS